MVQTKLIYISHMYNIGEYFFPIRWSKKLALFPYLFIASN